MINAATLNNSFMATVARARPASHLAALTLLGTSIYAVHEGADAVLPAGLTVATTAAMLGMEWLQWTALGRIAKLDDAGEHNRASILKAQCVGIGGLQVVLYSLAVVNFARQAGGDWSQGWALFGTVLIAMLYACLNFFAKWTSCDPVGERGTSGGPTGGQRVHDVLFNSPALPAPAEADVEPADWANDPAVIKFVSREQRLIDMDKAQSEALAKAPPVRSAAVRLRNAKKRMETRDWRRRKAAA